MSVSVCLIMVCLFHHINACAKHSPETLCINSKYALYVQFQVGQMEWVSDTVSERRAGVVKFLFFWIIVTLRKKAKKIFRNDVITESIYIKSYCNQSGLSFNISTKFHQNLTHGNWDISCKSETHTQTHTHRQKKLGGVTVSQTVTIKLMLHVNCFSWISYR